MDTVGFSLIAVSVIAFSLASRRLEGTMVTAPMLFAGLGLVIGHAGTGLADLELEHGMIHGLFEVTLILVLFSDAARIDLRRVRSDHGLPIRMLLLGLPLIILLGTGVALLLPLGLTLWEAALLAAVLAPTDAALGQSVVSSPLVPPRVRQALNIESGLNDGLALPAVLLFAFLASAGAGGGEGERDWLLFGGQQIVLGPIAGIVVGGLGAWLIDRAVFRGWMAPSYEGPAALGVALLAYSGAEIIGGNGFIAAFVAGMVFGNWVRDRCRQVFEFAEAEGQLLTLIAFLVFGATLLPQALAHIGWSALVYVLLSLTLIRMLPIAAALIGAGVRGPTVAFLAWFGPRGLASILFALFVLEEAAVPAADTIMTITMVAVAASILAHGLSAAPLARLYAASAAGGDGLEHQPVSEMPTRAGMVSPKATQ